MPSRAEIVLFDVPGLPAKPIIDIDLTVADPGREQLLREIYHRAFLATGLLDQDV